MARRHRNKIFEEVEILDIASEGKSIARVDDFVIFVTGAIPGDVCDLRVTKKKKNFMEALPVKFHRHSEKKVEAFCKHFGLCGGCKWQSLTYQDQLFYKEKQVRDQLERLAKVELPEISPILGSATDRNYRNKMDFTFTDKRWLTTEEMQNEEVEYEKRGLGFHLPGQWSRILHVDECHLQAEPSNKIRNSVYEFAVAQGFSSYNQRSHEGLMRNLIIRSASTGDLMVIVQFGEDNPEAIDLMMSHLKSNFPEITSLLYVVNTKNNDTFHDLDIKCFHGLPYIEEEMEGLRFRVGPKSFYQTNSEQAYELYKITRDFAQLSGDELVYDLYTGTGTIAQFVSRKAKEVVGIEYVEAAIEDAKKNAELNNIQNTKFYAGDMKDLLTHEFIEEHGKPDVVITDPPRAGMHQDVVERIVEAGPEKVVYVSCNPATQARDIALMDEHYKVVKVQPVDMFPQTYHVENVVLLERRK